jgi:hypothetical protein
MCDADEETKPIGPLEKIGLILGSGPWFIGLLVGIVCSPFICGFWLGLQIAKEAFGPNKVWPR